MTRIIYCKEGRCFSDFEVRHFWENEEELLKYLKGKKEIKVSNGMLIQLIQILMAKRVVKHTDFIFVMNGEQFVFAENGQFEKRLPEDNPFDLAFKMSRHFISVLK